MTLNAFQFSYGGLTMGDGTAYDTEGLAGFEDLPSLNRTDVDRGRYHGQFLGAMYAGGREVTANIETSAATDTAFRAALDALNGALVPNPTYEGPLLYHLPGFTDDRQINARVIARVTPVDVDYIHHVARTAVKWWATDPRIYSLAAHTLTLTNTVTTGTTNNVGTTDSPGIITINGPCVNPAVSNAAGLLVGVTDTLGGGDQLVIDLYAQTVLKNGSNWQGYLSNGTTVPAWPAIAKGSQGWTFSFTSASAGASCAIQFHDAWI